jgi:hypothetical protein
MVPLVVVIKLDMLAPIAEIREALRSCSDTRTMSDIIREDGQKSTGILGLPV